MRKPNTTLPYISSSLGVCCCLLLNSKATAAINYWDPTGSSGNSGTTGTWEGSFWSTAVGGTASPGAFAEGSLPVFSAGVGTAGLTYTITANANHTIAGLFNGGINGDRWGNVTVNGPGILSIASGFQGFLTTNGASTFINAQLAGTGGVQTQGGGSTYLYGNNSYSGGTQLNTGAGLNFNNNNSFGTGSIQWGTAQTTTTSTVLATPDATGPITIANSVLANRGTQIFAGVAAAPVTFSGSWTLPSVGTTATFQNVTASGHTGPSKVTISGAIGGAGNLTLNGTGQTILKGANTYTGTTTVGGTATITLGTANTIASSSKLVLSGATLDPDGHIHSMGTTTLGLTVNSKIDFGTGPAELDFANSSGQTWAGLINLANWDSLKDTITFGTDTTGLTSAQESDFLVNGVATQAFLDPSGHLEFVPEPSTTALGVIGGFGMLMAWMRKRKSA